MLRSLVFNELIAILLDCYFEFLISGYLQLYYQPNLYSYDMASERRLYETLFAKTSYTGDVFSIYIARFGLFLVLAVLPALFIWMLFQDLSTLQSFQFKQYYG